MHVSLISSTDPLNWPLWKKDLMMFVICIDTAVVGAWVSKFLPQVCFQKFIDSATRVQ